MRRRNNRYAKGGDRYITRLLLKGYRNSGFTLLEILVVMVMVGILAAIAAPSYLGFINNQRLTSAQGQALSILRQAQSNAKRTQTPLQVTFRNTSNASQYVIHAVPPTSMTKEYWDNLPWQAFDGGVRIVDNTEPEPRTTLTKLTAVPEPDVYRVQFKPQGHPNGIGELGRITFASRSGGDRRKCVIISTILGSMRVAEDSGCNQ